MSEFLREEELLRRGLRRRDPRDGFAERVLARLDEPPPRRREMSWWSWLWSPAFAAALMMIVIAGGVWLYQQRVERERRALSDLTHAMEITDEKLQLAVMKAFRVTESAR